MPISDTLANPVSSEAILALVAALGLSSTAGLRAVATLFAIGLVSDVSIGGHALLPLQGIEVKDLPEDLRVISVQ